MNCSICRATVISDYPEVPLCGMHVTEFVASPEFDRMFVAAGRRAGTTPAVRIRYRTLFVDRKRDLRGMAAEPCACRNAPYQCPKCTP